MSYKKFTQTSGYVTYTLMVKCVYITRMPNAVFSVEVFEVLKLEQCYAIVLWLYLFALNKVAGLVYCSYDTIVTMQCYMLGRSPRKTTAVPRLECKCYPLYTKLGYLIYL